jgi:hypothetical protein
MGRGQTLICGEVRVHMWAVLWRSRERGREETDRQQRRHRAKPRPAPQARLSPVPLHLSVQVKCQAPAWGGLARVPAIEGRRRLRRPRRWRSTPEARALRRGMRARPRSGAHAGQGQVMPAARPPHVDVGQGRGDQEGGEDLATADVRPEDVELWRVLDPGDREDEGVRAEGDPVPDGPPPRREVTE